MSDEFKWRVYGTRFKDGRRGIDAAEFEAVGILVEAANNRDAALTAQRLVENDAEKAGAEPYGDELHVTAVLDFPHRNYLESTTYLKVDDRPGFEGTLVVE
jgi:hypothetical protein